MKQHIKPNQFPGLFIELAGPDGCGKTTNAKVLIELFRQAAFEVVHTREPGGTPLAESIRNTVLHYDGSEEPMSDLTELLLFGAARAQHLKQVVYPALEEGKIVVCDRFSMSTRAYQGYGRGLLAETMQMEELIHPSFKPDYILYFDVPFQVSLDRAAVRNGVAVTGDRFEDADYELKERIYCGFRNELIEAAVGRHSSPKIELINAAKSLDAIALELSTFVNKVIRSKPMTIPQSALDL